jgi:hypothetical protein
MVVKRQARQGIRWGLMVNIRTGGSHEELILEFPKAKDRKEPHAGATYAPLTFCPFCGVKQGEKPKAKKVKTK